MCDECGCNEETIVVNKSLTEKNNNIAHHNWHKLIDKKIICINIMGSPGSGKTTFLELLSNHLDKKEIFVIQGDLESDVDKERLESQGIGVYQINTHSGCHLTAQMIHDALHNINLSEKKYLFIENIGNLVCPAGVKLGEHMDITVSSVTEGSDKPKKYPQIFMDSDMIVISKTDISKYVEFNRDEYIKDLKNINSKAEIVEISNKSPDSVKKIAEIIKKLREEKIKHSHHHH